MKFTLRPRNIDVVIICGGKGKRLKSVVDDRPKPMAEIGDRPFLDILIDYLVDFGFRRFILCISHKGSYIKKYYDKAGPLNILFSYERIPLGTAGAIKNAETIIKSSPFLVLNGDSLCKIDFDKFINFFFKKKAKFSLVLVKTKQTGPYGVVRLGSRQEVTGFYEKKKTKGKIFINAGVYLFDKGIFSIIPYRRNFSLEYDLFPKIINKGFYGYRTKARLIDIGTPARYRRAQRILN